MKNRYDIGEIILRVLPFEPRYRFISSNKKMFPFINLIIHLGLQEIAMKFSTQGFVQKLQ